MVEEDVALGMDERLAISSQEGGFIFDLSDPDKSCVGP